MRDGVIVMSRRGLVLAAIAFVLVVSIVVLGFVPGPRDAIASTVWPRATADPATLAQQRAAAEHSLQRGYAKAVDQLRRVRELRLAIPQAEADAIEAKARQDLAAVRRQGLAAVGTAVGLSGPGLEQYVAATEPVLDGANVVGEGGVLLAPGLFDVVRQADQLFRQVADTATTQLTRAPGSPLPSPTQPSPPLQTPRPSPSPSPTGR